jgi:hypothetical protein
MQNECARVNADGARWFHRLNDFQTGAIPARIFYDAHVANLM